jgi:ankyrin repeat protein
MLITGKHEANELRAAKASSAEDHTVSFKRSVSNLRFPRQASRDAFSRISIALAWLLSLTLLLWGAEARAQQPTTVRDLDNQLLKVARKGDSNAVRQLLDKGANIEARDQNGKTTLMLARNVRTMKLLLERGANVEATDNEGRTALIAVASWGNAQNVEFLLEKGANIEARDDQGRTALITAASADHGRTVKLLLEKGANIEARDNEGQTPLIAAVADQCGMFCFDFDFGPLGNFMWSTFEFVTAFPKQLASGFSRPPEPVRVLLEKGANIEARDNHGQTVLIAAASSRTVRKAEVNLLLGKGPDIEANDDEGETALIAAAFRGNAHNVKLLLDKGANIEARDNAGDTALIWATRSTYWDEKANSTVRLLLARGAKIEAKDNQGRTALLEASSYNAHLVKLLLEKGADIEARDNAGDTALSLAISAGNTEVVPLLNGAARPE